MAKYDFRKTAKRAAGIPQEFMVSVVDGTVSGGSSVCTGITRSDGLLSVLRFSSPNDPVAKAISEDLVATTSIPANGYIAVAGTVNLVSDQLLVLWLKFAV